MKIAIISDSHDNLVNINKMLKYVKENRIKTIIHCGDVCSPEVLRYLAKNFKNNIYLILGNVFGTKEGYNKKIAEYKNVHILEDGDSIKITNLSLKIGLTHYPKMAKEMAKTKKYDVIFYGHSHKPWEERIGQTRLINPGTLAGLFYKASFAVWDTDKNKFELKILELI
ncbi:MAG: YfcE family phosphodiesterase [Patescibacteria group bacterium]